MSGTELIELRRELDRLEARWLRGLAGFDRDGAWAADGAVSTVGWLRAHRRLSAGAARDAVTLARRLAAELPATAAAFAAGTLSRAHARMIATATDGLTRAADEGVLAPSAVAEIETTLAEVAGRVDPTSLHRLGVHLRHAAAPQTLLDAELTAHQQRRLHLSRTLAGTVAVDGLLDAEGGAVLLTALDALLSPPPAGDVRSPAQRRADALVDLARAALDAAALPDTGGDRPHLTVTADLTTLTARPGAPAATLDWGGPLSGTAARRIGCDAALTRVLTAGRSEILDVGRRTRIVPAGLRRALTVRDRGCAFPGCDRPPAWTEAHHLRHWADGGPTALPNLVLLCRAHHRLVHEDGWTLHRHPDGQLTATPPSRAGPTTRAS